MKTENILTLRNFYSVHKYINKYWRLCVSLVKHGCTNHTPKDEETEVSEMVFNASDDYDSNPWWWLCKKISKVRIKFGGFWIKQALDWASLTEEY